MAEFDALPEPDADNAKLNEFNEKWEAELAAKAAEEEATRQTMVEKAKEELAEWEKQQEVQRESKTSQNRQEEQVVLEDIEREMDPENGNPWERVVKLVEIKAEPAEGELDVSRMKSIFLQMKNKQK
eukprot:CAMPEP_0205921346 /NCGR_PEP_ID=MMETSP1325-20131115/12696_1 /ASSEMBLY_ACC=CAM_ASM_000708 /TAXON_ID=236786 /ORGANISM="Florenciella sp., Strain RCC1007" /LENGTH=126 /DNA_ID=CAMNT_0053289151 /DNA_START=11 /DNA_END=391 /DNA_ORIENTATION=-